MKFSYIRSVRSSPIGLPVQWSTPSRQVQVSRAQLMLCQPARSLPLNSGVKPSSCAVGAGTASRAAMRVDASSALGFMAVGPTIH